MPKNDKGKDFEIHTIEVKKGEVDVGDGSRSLLQG